MTNASNLLKRCRDLGATFTVRGERLHIQAPEPLPDGVVLSLKALKQQVLLELEREHGRNPECQVLEEWRRVSIPEWRATLQTSIEQGVCHREQYARWMLREVLLDPAYEEQDRG